MQFEDFELIPFDPARGILFKFGRVFQDRERQVREFEGEIGAALPHDFLELIGEYCEGGFDGFYRVHARDGVEVIWQHLLLMKLPDPRDSSRHNTLRIIRESRFLHDDQGLALLPFGEASSSNGKAHDSGFLTFDLRNSGSVVYVPTSGTTRLAIADTFREMMSRSEFVFFG